MQGMVSATAETLGEAYPELRGEPGVRHAGRRLGGGAILGDPAPGDGDVSLRGRGGVRRRHAVGRRRLQAARHARIPEGADRGAGGRGGTGRRPRSVRRAHGGAAPTREGIRQGRATGRGARGGGLVGWSDRVRRLRHLGVRRTRHRADRRRRHGRGRGGGAGGAAAARPHAVLRRVRRAGGGRRHDQDAGWLDPRDRRAVGAGRGDRARRRRDLRRGEGGRRRAGRGRRRSPRGHHSLAHGDAHRPLDAEAPARRARSPGGFPRRAGPAAVRLPASRLGAARRARAGRGGREPAPRRGRRGAHLPHQLRRGAAARGRRAVRREVRRHGPGGRGRGVLARALRRDPRSPHGQHRRRADPQRGQHRGGDAPGRGAGRAGRAARDQPRASAARRADGGPEGGRPAHRRRIARVNSCES